MFERRDTQLRDHSCQEWGVEEWQRAKGYGVVNATFVCANVNQCAQRKSTTRVHTATLRTAADRMVNAGWLGDFGLLPAYLHINTQRGEDISALMCLFSTLRCTMGGGGGGGRWWGLEKRWEDTNKHLNKDVVYGLTPREIHVFSESIPK